MRGPGRALVRAVILAIIKPLFRMKFVHIERIPKEGAVLVVANHLANADPLVVNAAFPRPLHFMGKKELFEVPLLHYVLRFGGCFPVDRGKSDRAAIRHAVNLLTEGIPVGIFPEGTRSITRSLARGNSGVGLLALMSGVPIQPIVVTGTERLPMNGAKGKLAEGVKPPDPGHEGVRVLFGEPFLIPKSIDGRRVTSEEATDIIMIEIARLLPPDYRGVYADALANEQTRRALPA